MVDGPAVPPICPRTAPGRRSGVLTLAAALLLLAAAPGWGAPPSGLTSLVGPTADKPLAEPQLDTPTFRLVRDYVRSPSDALQRAASDQLSLDADRVLVAIDMLDETAAEGMAEALPGLGAQVTARHRRWLEAWVPVARLREVARRPGVSLVRRPAPLLHFRPDPPRPASDAAAYSTGAYQTQGVAKSNANLWQATGLQGGGRKVGIMDSFKYWTNARAAGELPPDTATTGTVGEDSDHGTNVAEIIYDMAPAAALTITTPSGGCAAQAASILGFAQAGHDIISSSIGSLHCGAGDGDPATDPIASAARDALNTYGTLFFQAAGNHVNKHWDGTYNGGGNGTTHLFATGQNVNQLGYLQAGYPIVLFLRWNAWPTTNQDYDLYLLYSDGVSGWQLVAKSEISQTGTQPPEEAIAVNAPANGYYGFAIAKYSASTNHVLTSLNFYWDLQYKVQDRSLVGPATNPYTVAVAAVDVGSLALENYSSWGPSYGPGGSLSGGWAQPLISGFANVSTWVGAATGSPPFNGTSSATPHVSGAAAVAWGANPCLTPLQLLGFMEGRSTDAGTAGYDLKYGYGILNLGQPVNDGCQMERADFNGDGFADILWRSRTGALYLWFMAGNGLFGSTSIPPISTAWQVQGVGDFNGDGRSDILWRDVATGSNATYLWLMNGGSVVGQGYASQQPDGTWRIQGIGDFNGDGKSDILWRHSGGALYLWFMNGTTVSSVLAVPEISNIWQIVRVADFNGDGRADMLWRDTNSGATYMWLMNGSTVTGMGYTSSLTNNAWRIQGVGDFNKDGRADILWRETYGALYVWFMNGTSVIGSSFLASIDNSWQVEGVADLNGEGHADILWRHPASSATYVWLMDGATVAAAGYTTAQADRNWFARPVFRHR